MSISIFNYKDYKQFLRKATAVRGQLSRLATAAGCHPSYLSQAVHNKVHLTPDQTLGIARHLNLSENETDFFLALVDHARAGTKELRSLLERKMHELRAKHENITHRLRRTELDVARNQAFYFSKWIWSAVHVLTAIPDFQSTTAIGERLGMSRNRALALLTELERSGFVRREEGRWKYSGGELHLPHHSPYVVQHHSNWRGQAILNAQLAGPDNIHFTGVYALSKADVAVLKEKMLKLLEEISQTVAPSSEEEAVCILCDFFTV